MSMARFFEFVMGTNSPLAVISGYHGSIVLGVVDACVAVLKILAAAVAAAPEFCCYRRRPCGQSVIHSAFS